MQIGRIAGATRMIGKSQGYLGLPLRDEPIHCTVGGEGTSSMVTAWLPMPDELAALNAGAAVHVRIIGTAHPPLMVTVGQPTGGSSRGGAGRVPKNSIRAVASWLQKGAAHELLTGLGLAIAPAVIGFAIEHISAHVGTPMAEAAVHTAVNGLASRLGVAAAKAGEILRSIVDKLVGLLQSRKPAASASAAKPASRARPSSRAMPRGSQRRSAVLAFAARTPADLALKTAGAGADDDPAEALPVLLAVRDALDAAQS